MNRALLDWHKQRRSTRLEYRLTIHHATGDRTYTMPDYGGSYPWLLSVSGGSERLRISLEGCAQEQGRMSVQMAGAFSAHLGVDPSGQWADVCAASPYSGQLISVYSGILDIGGYAYDAESRTFEVEIIHPWELIQDRTIPAYRLNRTDLPRCPDDAVGTTVPLVFGRVTRWPLKLIADFPNDYLASDISPAAATINLEDAADFPAAHTGGVLDGVHLAGAGSLQIRGTTASDWPQSGLIKIDSELIGYYGLTVASATVVAPIYAFRGYGSSVPADHADAAAVTRLNVAIIAPETDSPEVIAYADCDGISQLTGCVRGILLRAPAKAWLDGARVMAVRECPIIHAANGAAAVAMGALRQRDSDDALSPVAFPYVSTVADTDTITGQTMATIRADTPLFQERHIGFETAEQQTVYYPDGIETQPGGAYHIGSFDAFQIYTGTIANDNLAHDSDFDATFAEATQLEDIAGGSDAFRWLFVDDSPAGLRVSCNAAYVYCKIGSTTGIWQWGFAEHGIATHMVVTYTDDTEDVFFDGFGYSAFGPTLVYHAIDADRVAASEIASIAVTVDVQRYYDPLNPLTAINLVQVYECGFVATFAGVWGWTDADKTITPSGGGADFGYWASIDANQIDILSLETSVSEDAAGRAIGALWQVMHQETGAAGDWTARHARIRFGPLAGDCGALVEIPLRAAMTDDIIYLPFPQGDLSSADTAYVEIITQAAVGLYMAVFECHLRLWLDYTADRAEAADDARDLVLATMTGVDDGTGQPIEQPADLIEYALVTLAGVDSSRIDSDAFTISAAETTASGWALAGQILDAEPIGSVLQRISGSAAMCPVMRGASIALWQWPADGTSPVWQFCCPRRGPGNAWSPQYSRTDLTELAPDLTVHYQPRPYTTERRMVRTMTAGRRTPPPGFGGNLLGKTAYRLDMPYRLSAQATPDNFAAYNYPNIPPKSVQADWIDTSTAAGLLLARLYWIFSRRRTIVEFGCGPEAELVPLGSLVEWTDTALTPDDLMPFGPPLLSPIYSSAWWQSGIYSEDDWPDTLRGFYGIVIGKERVNEYEYKVTLLEWSPSYHPGTTPVA